MRVLSLGAGVQSTTLLLMIEHGEIEPVDLALFADTGWEPKAVYQHLDWLMETVEKTKIEVVSHGLLRDDSLRPRSEKRGVEPEMPLFMKTGNPGGGLLRRQCTDTYKIGPIRRRLQSIRHGQHVDMLMGISLDEWQRMKDAHVKYITNVYPLIDVRMTRLDCLNWLGKHGYPEPPKSACIGCPYHTNAMWRDMRDQRPEEWADAVAFDHSIREIDGRIRGELYVRRQLVPLEMVDLRTEQDKGQSDMFAEECSGMCGV